MALLLEPFLGEQAVDFLYAVLRVGITYCVSLTCSLAQLITDTFFGAQINSVAFQRSLVRMPVLAPNTPSSYRREPLSVVDVEPQLLVHRDKLKGTAKTQYRVVTFQFLQHSGEDTLLPVGFGDSGITDARHALSENAWLVLKETSQQGRLPFIIDCCDYTDLQLGQMTVNPQGIVRERLVERPRAAAAVKLYCVKGRR